MARRKMTEAEKMTARARREEEKKEAQNAFKNIKKQLKRLEFSELDHVIELASYYKKERLGEEELRLINKKEKIEQELKNLKAYDEMVN